MSFRKTNRFDALFTTCQILIVQSGFYLALSALVLVVDSLLGFQISLDQLLDWNTINYHTFSGWIFFFIGLVNACVCTMIIFVIVQRAKLCLDFACTCYFINLCINWIYTGSFPTCIFWWIYCISGASILSAGSEYLCMNQELKPIILGKEQEDQVEMIKLNSS